MLLIVKQNLSHLGAKEYYNLLLRGIGLPTLIFPINASLCWKSSKNKAIHK
jgi:hypothetical protein